MVAHFVMLHGMFLSSKYLAIMTEWHLQCFLVKFVYSCTGLDILFRSIPGEVRVYSWPQLRCQHPYCPVLQIQVRSDKENIPKQRHIFPWKLRKRTPVKWYTPHSRDMQNNIILLCKHVPMWRAPEQATLTTLPKAEQFSTQRNFGYFACYIWVE